MSRCRFRCVAAAPSWLTTVFLLVVLATTSTTTAQPQPLKYLASHMNPSGLRKLVPAVDQFLQAVLEDVNSVLQDTLQESASIGTCCGAGDFGVKASLQVFDFVLDSITEDQIEITARNNYDNEESSSSDSKNRIRMGSAATNLAMSAGAAITFGAAALIPLECQVGATVGARLNRFDFGMDIDLSSGNNRLGVSFGELNPGSVTFDVEPILGSDCSRVSGMITDLFGTLSNQLTIRFNNIFGERARSFVANTFDNVVSFSTLPDNLSLEVLPGRSLSISPSIDTLAARSDGGVDSSASSVVSASLSEPAWRRGRSYTSTNSDNNVPQIDRDSLFNLRIGEAWVNDLIGPLWYLAWSTFVDNQSAGSSPLCASTRTDTDPCPFPPVEREVGSRDSWLLRILFLRLFGNFAYQVVVPPPRVRFENSGLAGLGTVRLMLQGLNPFLGGGGGGDLALISADVSARGSMPRFNGDTGKFTALALNELSISNVKIDFQQAPRFSYFTTNLANAAARVFNAVSDTVLTLANDRMASVLDDLPALKIPDFDRFPVETQRLQFGLPNVDMTPVSATETTSSYLDISADLGVSILNREDDDDDSSRRRRERRRAAKDVTTNPAAPYYDRMYTWAQTSNNPNAVFSSIYISSNEQAQAQEQHTLRMSAAAAVDGTGTLEELDSEGNWVKAKADNIYRQQVVTTSQHESIMDDEQVTRPSHNLRGRN